MEPGHGSGTSSDLRIHPATNFGEGNHFTPDKKLSASLSLSSSSSSSSFGGAFELEANEITKHDKKTQLASDHSEEDIPVSSMPRHEQPRDGVEGPSLLPVDPGHVDELSPNNKSETQFPPMQVMERTDDSTPSSSYRIPSYVFARTKSTAPNPMEWSVASNESLFSIHMGNMSFTNDQMYWLGKSGELGLHSEPPVSGPLIDYSSNQHPIHNSTEISKMSGNLDKGVGVTEAAAAEMMREVIRENEEDRRKEKLSLAKEAPQSARVASHRSNESGASVKSFAFPILIGEGNKSGSLQASTGKRKQQPQTPKATSQPQSPKATSQQQPQPQSQPQSPKAVQNVAQTRWLPRFSCCPFCT